MRWLFPWLMLLAGCPNPVPAQIPIPAEYRVLNRKPGFCAWCCLETIGRVQKLPQLDGLVDWYEAQGDGTATQELVALQLNILGLAFEERSYGDQDFVFLKQHTKAGRPVVIGMKDWYYAAPGYHAVLVTEVTDDDVWMVDPNDETKFLQYSYSPKMFQLHWTGWAVAVKGVRQER